MQSESVLILVFIFIILIAVVVIGILYSMHVSKYDESHTFYKNLLEIIKTNPNLSLDLQDKLLEKDFDISDLSTSQIELSNIFGAKIYSDSQIDRVNEVNKTYTEDRITTFTSNILLPDTELKYYQTAYTTIHTKTNNLSNLYNDVFNNTDSVYDNLSNLNKVYDIHKIVNGVMSYSNMNDAMNRLQDDNDKYYKYDNDITLNSNLVTNNSITINSNLKICNASGDKCFELSVDNNGILMGKSNKLNDHNKTPFVFGDNNQNCNLWLVKEDANAVPSYTNYVIST
jgi:hypothetical protein